ncbi:MAG: tRNA threonylcarbamoyladenosine dehydratase [Bacteroidales bacterium]|nr:tRNA threonylcarbamoyladenosine dehydratase [Bacteroidales bacterium]MEE3448110.1 tRNA threonylcarbamoyladenosine dehydratase [Bacteroidales bacterium]
METINSRTELLLGKDTVKKISGQKVIIFGLGGVGSWAAEGLVRSGFEHITLVDADKISVTNLNRQLPALNSTIGEFKADVLKKRLSDINPKAEIIAVNGIFTKETAESFHLDDFDVIIDAIDSLTDKAELILRACKTEAYFISSMGAALKLDPLKIQVSEFWKVSGCPLARALRQKFKRMKNFPAKKFQCVFSGELLENKEVDNNEELKFNKAKINGSMVHITAVFGFFIVGEVIKKFCL